MASCRPRRSRRPSRSTRSTPRSRRPGRSDGRQDDRTRHEHHQSRVEERRLAATEVKGPNIGDFKDIPGIQLLVKQGDTVQKDDSLLVLESDKATLEVPAPAAGVISELKVKIGDKVSAGTLVALLEGGASAPPAVTNGNGKAKSSAAPAATAAAKAPEPAAPSAPAIVAAAPASSLAVAAAPSVSASASEQPGVIAHASPGVRRFARELGVPVAQVTGSGPKNRILKEDIQSFVKQAISGGVSARGGLGDLGLPPWPKVDFAKFGPIEVQARTRIQKI